MDSDDRDLLIESAASAWRPRLSDGLPVHPAWHDLDEEGRNAAFDATRELRAMESALHPMGLSTTVQAVLARIEATR